MEQGLRFLGMVSGSNLFAQTLPIMVTTTYDTYCRLGQRFTDQSKTGNDRARRLQTPELRNFSIRRALGAPRHLTLDRCRGEKNY